MHFDLSVFSYELDSESQPDLSFCASVHVKIKAAWIWVLQLFNVLGTELGGRITLDCARSHTENHLLKLQKVVQQTWWCKPFVGQLLQQTAPWPCTILFVKGVSLLVSHCPRSLRKVSCRTGGKYYCFNYQELILTCIHCYLFTTPEMCCKGLHYVSYVLMSTALFSFSYGVPYWLLLRNSYRLDSVPIQLYFHCWLLWEQTLSHL